MVTALPAVRLDQITKSFGDRPVLRGVSLEVPSGRACCILGRSGTGKSVTLKHMIGLVRPDSGRVFVQGEDITGLAPAGMARVRRGMGFLFQNAALFDSITVGENVAFPIERHMRLGPAEVRDRAQGKLADVGLGTEVEHVRSVGRVTQLAHEVVDRGAVGEVGEVHLQLPTEVGDVVQRPARGCANERVDVGAERHERLGQVGPHEPVRAGDEHRAPAVHVRELTFELVEIGCCPDRLGRHCALIGAVGFRVGGQGYR